MIRKLLQVVVCVGVFWYLGAWMMVKNREFWYRQPVQHYYTLGWGGTKLEDGWRTRKLASEGYYWVELQTLAGSQIEALWKPLTGFVRDHFRVNSMYQDDYSVEQIQWWCGWRPKTEDVESPPRDGEWMTDSQGRRPITYLLYDGGGGDGSGGSSGGSGDGSGSGGSGSGSGSGSGGSGSGSGDGSGGSGSGKLVGMIHGQPVKVWDQTMRLVDLLCVHGEYRGQGLAPVLITRMADVGGKFVFRIEGGSLPYLPVSWFNSGVFRGREEGGSEAERGSAGVEGGGLGRREEWIKLSRGADFDRYGDSLLRLYQDHPQVLYQFSGVEELRQYLEHPGVEGWAWVDAEGKMREVIWLRWYPVKEGQQQMRWMVEVWGHWGGGLGRDWWRCFIKDKTILYGLWTTPFNWTVWLNINRTSSRDSEWERMLGVKAERGPVVNYYFYRHRINLKEWWQGLDGVRFFL